VVLKHRKIYLHLQLTYIAYSFIFTSSTFTLGRPGHRWEGNIKMDLGEIGWGGMD
jgi:hypothetical protein